MAVLTFAIEPDELLGLSALVELSEGAENDDTKATTKADADAVGKARTLMRSALADELGKAGLPWAPSAGTLKEHAAGAAGPADALQKLAENQKARKDAGYVLVVAGLVALFGGYAGGWKWTGFQTNGQVWDWLNLCSYSASGSGVM